MTSSYGVLSIASLLIAVIGDALIIHFWRRRLHRPKVDYVAAIKNAIQVIYRTAQFTRAAVSTFVAQQAVIIADRNRHIRWQILIELFCVFCWAILVGKNLLNFSADQVPNGGEFSNMTQSHFIWTLLPKCGVCFLWNGFLKGGSPALAEIGGPILHPLVFIPVLLFGVVNGAKVTIILSLALAGMAQWGMAYKLKLGFVPRMWSALLVVAAGHLSSKMEDGDMAMILGLASAALVLMFGVDLLFNRNRKALVGMAVAVALTILAGEGYIQISLILCVLPILALFLIGFKHEEQGDWKAFLLSLGLGLLIAGIFLVPMAHFFPMLDKDGDENLANYQPLEYSPLNLVIRDMNFYQTDMLGKDAFAYTHVLYIGWAPVLLALLALNFTPTWLKRLLWIFGAGILWIFLLTSADLPRFLMTSLPIFSKLRHFPVTTGMVVPLIMTLAAISVDQILNSHLIHFSISSSQHDLFGGFLEPLILIPILAISIIPVYNLSQEFLGTHDVGVLSSEIDHLETASIQWISPPFGHYDWNSGIMARGLKIANTWRPWFWRDHEDPQPVIETLFLPERQPDRDPIAKTANYAYLLNESASYAFVENKATQAKTACTATGQGGSIDVTCPPDAEGSLTVEENTYSGWQAWVDGKPASLLPSRWLKVEASGGPHTYQFRFYPWDVLVGLLVTLTGIFLTIRYSRKAPF